MPKTASTGSTTSRVGAAPDTFPPSVVVSVKALACQMPHDTGLPLCRFHVPDIQREIVRRGIVASIGQTTIWRWLSEDALRPWRYRSWIFPRDPNFAEKAGRVLDLYEGRWSGKALATNDFVLSADEKTSVQPRPRQHPTLAPAPARAMRVEHEYERKGSWAYLAAWDVHRAKVFGRCEASSGIKPFGRLLDQVMCQEPYRSARRVFWIVDNGTSHRGQRAVDRVRKQWPTVTLVHTPVHASWLNQIEIYFSIVQRKLLSPSNFASLDELQDSLLRFQDYYQAAARPFEWKFTRRDLAALLERLAEHEFPLGRAA